MKLIPTQYHINETHNPFDKQINQELEEITEVDNNSKDDPKEPMKFENSNFNV